MSNIIIKCTGAGREDYQVNGKTVGKTSYVLGEWHGRTNRDGLVAAGQKLWIVRRSVIRRLSSMERITNALKLPECLPALPPVPKGFRAWELCGWGGLNGPQKAPWSCSMSGCGDWPDSDDCYGTPSGGTSFFYIRARK